MIKILFKIIIMNKINLKLIPAFLMIMSLAIVISCSQDDALVSFESPVAISFDKASASVEVEETTTYDVVVSTMSKSTSDIVVDLVVKTPDSITSASLYSMTPSITIPAGELSGASTLSFSHSLLEFGDEKTIEVGIADSSRKGDVILNEERTSTTIKFVKKCTLNDVVVSITTDDYPEETLFRILDVTTDPAGVLIYQSPTYDDYPEETVDQQLCLDAGNYAIVVYDLYGDGIVDGGFTVSVNGVEVVGETVVAGATAVEFFDIL
jgi:hypothetical protein